MAVVVSDKVIWDGPALLRYLAAMPLEEVESRRRKMRQISLIMQWLVMNIIETT